MLARSLKNSDPYDQHQHKRTNSGKIYAEKQQLRGSAKSHTESAEYIGNDESNRNSLGTKLRLWRVILASREQG